MTDRTAHILDLTDRDRAGYTQMTDASSTPPAGAGINLLNKTACDVVLELVGPEDKVGFRHAGPLLQLRSESCAHFEEGVLVIPRLTAGPSDVLRFGPPIRVVHQAAFQLYNVWGNADAFHVGYGG